MKARVDKFGRIVIPKSLRRDLGLKPGTELALEERDRELIMRPVSQDPQVLEKDGVLVITGEASEDLAEVLAKDRESRAEKIANWCN